MTTGSPGERGAPPAPDRGYASHLERVMAAHAEALQRTDADGVVIDAGAPRNHFRDDHAPPFRSNPLFEHWLPVNDQAEHMLVWRPGVRPVLLYLQPADYWHLPPAAPEGHWVQHIDVRILRTPEALVDELATLVQGRSLYLGSRGEQFGNLVGAINAAAAIDYLEFQRAVKTPWELDCMRAATARAVPGHQAAAAAFAAGGSEYEIHLAYLRASQQTERDLPYGNIVALNEHCGVLHYQHQELLAPPQRHAFLIDAGARANGYAADITRTYAAAPGLFLDVLLALDAAQRRMVDDIRVGMPYLALHERAHQLIAQVLCDAGVLTCDAAAAFDRGLTRTFLPHGLGHLLGLQTHDAGGQLADDRGTRRPPPAIYPALRNTRTIETGQVFTIEPGIYFIPMLLDELRAQPDAAVNWQAIDALLPCGGIRIEDNVHVLSDGVENLTREAFAAAAHVPS